MELYPRRQNSFENRKGKTYIGMLKGCEHFNSKETNAWNGFVNWTYLGTVG
jgi:hypothetical protein